MPKGKRLSMNGFPPLAGSVLMDTAERSSKRMTNRVVSRSTVFVSEKGWRLFLFYSQAHVSLMCRICPVERKVDSYVDDRCTDHR